MEGVHFDKAAGKKSAPLLEQELSHCGVLGQTNRPVESIRGLRYFPEPLQEVSANCPVRLISGDIVRVDPIQHRQPRFGSICFGHCRGVSGLRAERRRYADQLFIKPYDRFPLNPAAARPLGMYRLNRGFKLKAAEPSVS